MATEVDIQALIWALGILAVPVVAAIPLRFIWRFWIGGGHEESEYRTTVRQIIDAGRQIESYRHALNDIARSLRLTPSRQRLIEADILNPLSITHFLILPALIIFPLAFVVALPLDLCQCFKPYISLPLACPSPCHCPCSSPGASGV